MDCGDQALLPAVRDADPQTQIVADGFSCKTQIKDAGTGRKALHVAQLMKLAREEGGAGASRKTRAKAERSVLSTPAPRLSRRAGRVAAVVAASTVAGSAAAGVRAVTHQD